MSWIDCPSCGRANADTLEACATCHTALPIDGAYDTPGTDDQKQFDVVEWTAVQLTRRNPPDAIAREIHTAGLFTNYEEASSFVAQVQAQLDDVYSSAKRKAGQNRLFWGIAVAAVGGLVSLATYELAPPGGTYVVFTGAMISGGLLLIKGLILLAQSRLQSQTYDLPEEYLTKPAEVLPEPTDEELREAEWIERLNDRGALPPR